MRGSVRVRVPVWVLVLVLVGWACGRAAAQVDPGAPEGAVQTVAGASAWDRYALPIGTFGLDAPAVREVEGAVTRSAWRLEAAEGAPGAPEGAPVTPEAPEATVAGVMKGYRERLEALGFDSLFECAGEACGGFDFRFGAEILAPPGMLVDVRDFAQLSAERAEPAGFVSVLVSRVLESIYVQTVFVDPAAPPPTEAVAAAQAGAEAGAEAEAGSVASPEEPAAEADVPGGPADAAPPEVAAPVSQEGDALFARLASDGHVPVQGVDFEVGGDALSTGSAAALDRLAAMLSGEGAPSVVVVGHSDNQGGLELNIELSRRRAESVRQALIERGVPAERLAARGVGFLAPLASNATEAGRALNRRVELVLR